ncbi:transcriptional regulator GcvA [Paremcibacter congregatus]|uniref:transcriptional regulator GcvA n=1 Tax=Paremcibacter congregatus TaxID=2043170 RepID=UPI003A94A8F4
MKRHIPPLNALKSFEAAARMGSFRDAAEELHVSHSAVSHQIKRLEEYLETELFIRHPRSVELSKAGKKYYPVLRDAFDRIAEGTKTLLKPHQRNVLTIQTYSTFAIRWLIQRLPDFNAAYPDLQVRLNTAQSDVDFDNEDIDLAVMIGHPENSDLAYEYLFSPELFPVCAPALLSSDLGLKSPADLAKHTILQVYPSERDWEIWLSKNKVENVDLTSGINLDSYDHALKTAVRGIGVALGMQPYVKEDLDSGHLVRPFGNTSIPAPGNWFMVYPKEKHANAKVNCFRGWLLEQICSDPELSARRIEGS